VVACAFGGGMQKIGKGAINGGENNRNTKRNMKTLLLLSADKLRAKIGQNDAGL
jgi:hypothetical protein